MARTVSHTVAQVPTLPWLGRIVFCAVDEEGRSHDVAADGSASHPDCRARQLAMP